MPFESLDKIVGNQIESVLLPMIDLQVETIHTRPTVDVQVLPTSRWTVERLSRLLFVSTTTSYLFGMMASEYNVESNGLLVNVEKIDSTGEEGVKGLASTVLKAYFSFLVDKASALKYDWLQIHVFARSQPQYLFPESGQRVSKKVLGDSKLVQWWLNTLTSPSTDESCFWFIPNETETSPVTKSILKDNEWQWGLQQVGSCFPCFPDDPVAKCMSMDNDSNKLMELLGIAGECQRVCALLSKRIPIKPSETNVFTEKEGIDKESMDVFVSQLMLQDFGDADKSKEATATVRKLLSQHGPDISRVKGKPNSSSTASKRQIEHRIVNNLNSLVKKKKVIKSEE